MTLGDILSSEVLLKSVGVMGLLLGAKRAAEKSNSESRTNESPVHQATSREQLRNQYGLRAVDAREEGFGVSQLPERVYGFTYAPLGETPVFAKHAFQSFEVHKLPNGEATLLAFVTPPDASAIRDGQRELSVRLYPEAWDDATEMVAIPYSRLFSKRLLPSRERGGWIEATVSAAG